MKRTSFSLYGALIGDYYGSYWEFLTAKPKNKQDALKLRNGKHSFTDDTLMTLAIAKAVKSDGDLSKNAIKYMRLFGKKYPTSYGASFGWWLHSDNPQPYYSYGNGSAMRISPVGLIAKTKEECFEKSDKVTGVTHDHPFSLLYAKITAYMVFLARHGGMTKEIMKESLYKEFPSMRAIEELDTESLHKYYTFTEEVHETVPQALHCFFTTDSFEDCLAKSLYIGGDSDTLCAISCSIAAPFYGDKEVIKFVKKIGKLPKELESVIENFQS